MFLSPHSFPFVALLEQSWETILADLQRVEPHRFVPWVEPAGYTGEWSGYGLFHHQRGWVLERQCNAADQGCADTRRIVSRIQGVLAAGFSRLGPASHIHAHADEEAVPSVRCHLGLLTNDRAQLRVGSEVRTWTPGRCLLFSGQVEHEAVNEGDRPRVVLLVDVDARRAEAPLGEEPRR